MERAEPLVDDPRHALELPPDRPLIDAAEAARRALGRRGPTPVIGAAGTGPALLARALAAEGNVPVLYVCADADGARRAAADLKYLSRRLPAVAPKVQALPEAAATLLLLPAETQPYADVHPDRRAAMLRAGTLAHLAAGRPWRFCVTTAAGLCRRTVPPGVLAEGAVELGVTDAIDVGELAERLSRAGYLRAPVVEDPGSFAVRGGLVDAWAPASERPVRVELEGDLIAGIKSFDPDDQRTRDDLERVFLPPARETVLTPGAQERARRELQALADAVNFPSTKTRALVDDVASGRSFFAGEGYLPAFYPLVSLFEYVPASTAVLLDDPGAIVRALRAELEQALAGQARQRGVPHFPIDALYEDEDRVAERLGERSVLTAAPSGVASQSELPRALDAYELIAVDTPTIATRDQADLGRAVKVARTTGGKHAGLEPLLDRLALWRDAGLQVTITARAATQADRLVALLSHRDVQVQRLPELASAPAAALQIDVGQLSRGVIAPGEGFVLLTEEEIFGQRAHRPATRTRKARAVLEDLRALSPGDYVVHAEHGIGRYIGLERKTIGSVSVELLAVEYVGGKLFLPIYRLNQIQKYAGGDSAPKLDRLGGQSFAKTKLKVQRRVRQMADDLLRLYAERAALKKLPLPAADDDYAAFEATFPFEETRDQAAAISEVLRDLERDQVMDRLVCGDVGFGKTEVALRAAFRVAMAGRQVALLCPTTVLAQQHYLTFSSRLSGYPLEVRVLSRFQSKAEQQKTLQGLKQGSVDVVVGTHRLLSKDIHFKKLGLLVVDEEQRFGVGHKERIKQLRASVDVLTLSATPIPRTLQMAIGGLRDMSIIATAPVNRRAIRTLTSRWDEALVKEAILRELSRGGQVFYVYNRVEGLYERAARLTALIPEARIAVGHGQLGEAELERTMLDFVDGKYDVLVATAIVESGLDIPRANTIIVDRADLFGLSQLYQLRGRVGRSSERAYCYLLVPPPSELTDEARSRIEALERYTELGSGFQVATLDMELRGAGDLLGAEQSGFVASVGFDLFCRMLEEATHELRGEPVVHEVDPELSFDADALLPDDYVDDVGVRLSLYKRLASAADEAEVAEIAREMEDRFGPVPPEARHLVELMRLKTELRALRVLGCEASAKSATLHLREDTPLDRGKIGALVAQKGSVYRLTPDGRLTRRARETERFESGLLLVDRMLSELT